MAKNKTNQSVKKKRNTRGMGSIRQKNGGYEGRITIKVNGKSKQISLFNKDKRILVQQMIKAKQESNDNEYVEKDRITLEEWLKKWIRIHKRPFVKPRTLQGYIEKIKKNIIPYLGNYPMQSLDRLVLQEYFSDLTTGSEEKGIKKYSPKTIKELKSILNMAFTDAEIDKVIKFNPIPTIRTPKVQREKKKPTISPAEQKQLMQILLSETNGLCYIFIINTGVRPGENGGMKWKHYSYENANVKVRDNYGKVTYYNDDFEKVESKYEEKDLKTPSSYRNIPLQKWLNNIMYAYMQYTMEQKGYTRKEQLDNEYIFMNSRIVFSTYQTMINCIDTVKSKEGNKLFTAGHFDLIIIDEAHRSIYKKYQAIFDYFDGLLVGLTATPRSDVDKNTYKFFELENNVPTFVYEYDEAVKQGYLVNYHTIKTNTEFLDRGIKYSDLKEEDKEEYENLFEEGEAIPDEISSTAINSWLFNRDTIKLVLETLMERGLKVEGGDKLGKTIIFARNHKHAEEIVRVFDSLYPKYNGEFARVIDNQVNFASTVIETFEVPEKLPQIAVSVDMLDTGIDVPEVLNLVFFKPVKSKIKFWQMIGRGTRLCKDLFGEGLDKQQFYIFDCCRNFEFFEENDRGIEAGNTVSLTEKIYTLKLDLITELESMEYQSQEDYKKYREELVDEFVSRINNLNRESFVVRGKTVYIDRYSQKEKWNHIDYVSYDEIKEQLIPIFLSEDSDEYAKRFDNLVYGVQIGRMRIKNIKRQTSLLSELVEDLKKLGTVPQIVEKKELIMFASDEEYWQKADFFEIERARKELRELIKFIDNPPKKIWSIDIEDKLTVEDGGEPVKLTPTGDYSNYKRKVTKFLNGNLDNLIIYKIKHNQKLNDAEKKDLERIMFEELGNNSEFVEAFGNKNVIQVVRNIVGLDSETANAIFSKYINDNRLNSKQIQFVKMLIDYVIKNGTISLQVLTEDPFSSLGAVSEVFEDNIGAFKEIREDIEEINRNAEMYA